ncbi:glycoside hydrolase family 16 protein [Rhizoctonia solani]|uniref:Glycoside hydrolase family 16 protein n=1 Tax=Rhizoctonia solani TaxID=456999 RepID=A0A8H7M905_9AGAM|nr:glycoside hydrolase family 16 protein [Rhizoctonia solani]
MKAFTILAFAGIAAAQLPSFADSLNLVDTFMHDLQISFHEITGDHPRRSFHKRTPGNWPNDAFVGHQATPGPEVTPLPQPVLLQDPHPLREHLLVRTTTRTSSSTSSSTRTSSSVPSSTSSSTSSHPLPVPHGLYKRMEGNTFFDGWEFWSYPDPTNGNIPSPQSPSFTKTISTTGAVDYQNLDGSSSAGLHEINSDGHAIMRVETTQQVSGNRKSVRLHSHVTYNGGLVILDAVHMPYGYQPSFVAYKSGCTIPQEYGSSGTLAASLNCAADETGNQGCGQLNSKPNNYGKSFNDNGGGVYASIEVGQIRYLHLFLPSDEIPSDIENEAPRPDRWGTPVGNWPAQSCDPFEFMSDHIMIFDTTLCGDWAGNAWQSSGIAGQARTCADMTGYNTCLDYIRNEGSKLKDAFWEVKSVKLYT